MQYQIISWLGDEHGQKVSGNRVLGLKREEVTGSWRKLPGLMRSSWSSPDIRMIKSMRIDGLGLAARIGGKRNAYSLLEENLKKWRPLEDVGVNGRIILR
jgi:hypothetical protein